MMAINITALTPSCEWKVQQIAMYLVSPNRRHTPSFAEGTRAAGTNHHRSGPWDLILDDGKQRDMSAWPQ